MSITVTGSSLRLRLDRGDILSLHATELSFCSFGRLCLEWDERIYSMRTYREKMSSITIHELINRTSAAKLTVTKRHTPDCRISDIPLPDSPMAVRLIETADGANFHIIPSEGADFRLLEDYTIGGEKYTVGVITLPVKSSCALGRDRGSVCRLYLIPVGQAELNADGNLHIMPGRNAMILAAGIDPAEILAAVSKLIGRLELHLPAGESRLYTDTAAQMGARLAVMDNRIPPALLSAAEETALLLLGSCSSRGGIITGEKTFSLCDPAAVIECLARLGFTEAARDAAEKIADSQIYTPLQTAEAQIAYYNAVGDAELLHSRLPLLIDAAMELRNALSSGLLYFSGDEKLFAYDMLAPEAIDQASATAALRFIRLAQTVTDFVTEHRLRARKGYFDLLTEGCRLAKSCLMNTFYSDGMLWENNPLRQRYQRKPRFRFGRCEICGQKDYLERENAGHYTCLACRGKPFPQRRNTPQRIPAIGALEYAHGILPDEMLSELVCIHASSLLESDWDLTEGGSSGILLRLMAELISSGSNNDKLLKQCRALYNQTLAEGIVRPGCYRKNASPIDACDPAATAKCMLGLLAAEKVL